MTSALELIRHTEQHLLGSAVERRNRLAAAVADTTVTTINLTYDLAGIGAGSRIEIDAEEMYVWAVDSTAKTATVERGFNGSTAATHADDSIVLVNPRYPRHIILRNLNHELNDLSSPVNGLYQIATVDLTYSPGYDGYDLAGVTNLTSILDVFYEEPTRRDWTPIHGWRLNRNLPTADFASGMALFVPSAFPGSTIRVRYAAPFTTIALDTANVETTSGLPATAIDIPPLGAAARLVLGREVPRNQVESQPASRRAEEVPPGAIANSARGLMAMRSQRIADEAMRLRAQTPIRVLR